jgi:coniferyl-aldehyde dehydrogenase
MALLEAEVMTGTAAVKQDEAAAIEQLQAAFQAQQRAFAADRYPPPAVRRERLERIIPMMNNYRDRICDALVADFGVHPPAASDMLEVQPVTARVDYALAHLEEWMQPIPREVDAPYRGGLHAYIKSQPKGVVGNIVPWNFPFEIGFGPLVDMLASGNRVMLKPSEVAPACAELMREMAKATFAEDLVYVAVGGLELARAFSALPFDHLLYTGSSNVGRHIMAGAAKHLTPVTLELGGKCPALLLAGSVMVENVGGILGVKMIKNGQMCVSVDHCLVPRAEMEGFIQIAQGFMAQAAPDYAHSPACTGIISDRHLARLEELLADANAKGAHVVTLEKDTSINRMTRQMPLSLVVDPAPELRLMQEEIFGPILPIIPYDSIEEAIERINAGDRPLGLYVYGNDQSTIDHVLAATSSGGSAVNACAVQAALKALAFGGVGASGMGLHHGEEGFREFSNQRGIAVRGAAPQLDALVGAPA